MKDKYKEFYQDTLNNILSFFSRKLSSDQEIFIRNFYAKVPAPDLKDIPSEQAASMGVSAYEFIKTRQPGTPKIRIFTPTKSQHGWESPDQTVIELLNDDMPFLVDSLSMELQRQGIIFQRMLHPIFRVVRDAQGNLQEVLQENEKSPNAISESLIHFELPSLADTVSVEKLEATLQEVLKTVRLAVQDWQPVVNKVEEAVSQLSEVPKHFKSEEVSEVRDFLQWMTEKNFIFFGYIEYDFKDADGNDRLHVVEGSELGVFKMHDLDLKPKGLYALPPEVLHFALIPQIIEITKSNRKSVIHRPVHMDYIGVKRFNRSGEVIGERRFLGLFTSLVYYQRADDIPFIRRKISRVLARAGYDPVSHDGKALRAILEFFPRDELFQISEEDLFETSLGILSLETRPGIRLFMRKDAFERFVSCLVFVPREGFSTTLREQIQKILEVAFNGSVTAFYTQMTDSPLTRLHVIIRTQPGAIPAVDIATVEASIAKTTYRWSDQLKNEMSRLQNSRQANYLLQRYGNAFPSAYTSRYDAMSAIHDMQKMEHALNTGTLALELFQTKQERSGFIHLKIYNRETEIALSDILPVLENMGFRVIDETPYQLTPTDYPAGVWIRDFKLTFRDGSAEDVSAVKPLFEDAMARVWAGEIENDGFNALILRAGLPWRDIVMLRAYSKYLKQATFPYAQPVIERALASNPAIARTLVEIFHSRFHPAGKTSDHIESLQAKLDEQLSTVTNLAEDRILRRYSELMQATLRTNFFQPGSQGDHKPVLSFKFDSRKVPELPLPHPFREIFVYSPRVEGIHLRGGKVARGGLRWSDRPEDFRTEILGLVKAQMVKNAVIVPVGSKGGFVLKKAPPASDREAFLKEGITCYTLYLQGLLDITDNIVEGNVVPPEHVVRHDEDDPYLVVAADKGTASFSDYANQVSHSYQFWLGDAFASGGSAGYDHKEMGITAKGGWISVMRHFQEMGIDTQTTDFTAIGIGDMAGDVFGNGMLLSEHIRLVAAFNHMHIFIDPAPDAKTSFAERQRLFHLPRSSWKDYDAKLISKGGGIFERSAKSITLSAEAVAALGLSKDTMTPDELIRAILLAPVDLLWNGGIGTYVKAEDETHEQVGDRANNAVRVNGKELRCKVVGEGGNLGFTQKGRIEYARSGGRINTDAIDNSGGVDCSDHEVNIKIALSPAVISGRLSLEKRDALLESMTDDVSRLVLHDNRLQTQAITIAETQGFDLLDSHARLIRSLERQKLLDREIEFLPSEKQLVELKAAKKSLTRPELAVLLAYSKIALSRELAESDLPDNPYFARDLLRYFPKAMQEQFADDIQKHPLRREIISTVVTNSMINRVGMSFVEGIEEDTGIPARDIASAYTLVRDAFTLRDLWAQIEALDSDTHVTVRAKVEMFADINRFLETMTLWFLRNCPLPLDIATLMQTYAAGIQECIKALPELLSPPMAKAYQKKRDHYMEQQVPQQLAAHIAGLEAMTSACDIVMVANASKLPIATVGKVYFAIGAELNLGWLRYAASQIKTDSHWSRIGVQSLVQDLYDQQRRLTSSVITALCNDKQCSDSVGTWLAKHDIEVKRYQDFITDLKSNNVIDFPMLVVAAHKVETISAME